jgi:hypothetical protein
MKNLLISQSNEEPMPIHGKPMPEDPDKEKTLLYCLGDLWIPKRSWFSYLLEK